MANLEKITVIGNLAADAKLNEKDGKKWISFDVVANNKKEDTKRFYNSRLFGEQKNLLPLLQKGREVCVIGDFSANPNYKDGVIYPNFTIDVNSVVLTGSKPKDDTAEE